MIALEFVEPDGAPNPAAAIALLEEARERGLLVGKGGPHGNVIRLAPPMTLTQDEAEEALGILTQAVEAVAKEAERR
jgi:4-aminobutyrate aminotransferase